MIYYGLYNFIRAFILFYYMQILVPSTTESVIESQWEIAQTIVSVTSNEDQQALLVKIAEQESGFQSDIVHCQKKSSIGASGPWQVVPRTRAEYIRVCSSLRENALMALQRIEESRKLCKRFAAAEQLIQYAVGGDCTKNVALGKKMSRMRWSTNEIMNNIINKQ